MVALDHGRLVLVGPDDEDLALRVQEELRPVERGFGFGRAIGERAQTPCPKIAGANVQNGDGDREDGEADHEGGREDAARLIRQKAEIGEAREALSILGKGLRGDPSDEAR